MAEKLSQVSWCQKLHFLKGSFGSGSKSESIPTDSGKKSNFTAEINLLTAGHKKKFVYIANIIFYADVLLKDQFEFHKVINYAISTNKTGLLNLFGFIYLVTNDLLSWILVFFM